jgi:orotidine-5'-phosphate decarboxylase
MNAPRIVVALDCARAADALAFARSVSPADCRVKVGLELYTAAGPDAVRRLTELGFDVFLDLKFHDIPTTVARACRAASELGVWMLNVHTLGGPAMLRAAREALDSAPARRPLLIGVTVLTSHSEEEIRTIGLKASAGEEAKRLAGLARENGLDGVVCSPREAAALRRAAGAGFVLVTPGVRPAGAASNDQTRTLTPAEALEQGADYLVVGRPITGARDPLAALMAIRREIGEIDNG